MGGHLSALVNEVTKFDEIAQVSTDMNALMSVVLLDWEIAVLSAEEEIFLIKVNREKTSALMLLG